MMLSRKLSKGNFEPIVLKIEEINNLTKKEQEKYFENIFEKIYTSEEVESIKNCALKCIKLLNRQRNDKIRLPYKVIVEIDSKNIIIKLDNKKRFFMIIILLGLLLLTIIGTSYSYINYINMLELNKDIDGDGIADINIDLNKDRIPEVNVDTNKDNKPDYNIDYKGNRKPIFNIDTNHNGKADYNLINRDLNNDGKCDLNCDTNNDGWPDLNLDINGDMIADLYIDTDNDGKADLNFDLDNNMVCDLHCDRDGDKVCDTYCLSREQLLEVDPIKTGSSKNVGNKEVNLQTGDLILESEDDNAVVVTDIFPDDQLYYEEKIPTKTFRVMNKSGAYIVYNLKWVVSINDYVTDNFKYSVKSTLDGANFDFIPAPKTTSDMAQDIIIPPYSTQEYEVNFKLEGTHSNQNEDQGRTFVGHIEVYIPTEE